ncbi:RmlC-like cupin domain-containing protein [Mycena sanguinolenta]|nr:RmlC-like cupin domain-containing protein [Mycena sanguinolenta]
MLSKASFTVAVLASVISVHGLPAPQATVTTPGHVPIVTNGPEIASSLITEASEVDRLSKLLKYNGTLLTGEALRQLTVFDFNNTQDVTESGKGGTLLLATVDNFPILEGTGISAGVAFIEPCGLNIPHMHPRASEMLTVIEGILDTGFVQENGFATEVATELGLFQATVFPMGSIHYQQNPTCSKAMFVASLGSEDPGRSDIATNFWMLPPDIVNATLGFPTTIGGSNIDQWREHLPTNLALGVDKCLQACGLSA